MRKHYHGQFFSLSPSLPLPISPTSQPVVVVGMECFALFSHDKLGDKTRKKSNEALIKFYVTDKRLYAAGSDELRKENDWSLSASSEFNRFVC